MDGPVARTVRPARQQRFDLTPGRVLAGGYVVHSYLGGGWEGEVYRVVERKTGIHRAAKLFYPHRNRHDRAVRFYANKLERLRGCPIITQYHHSGTVRVRGEPITCMISELVEGELLSRFVARQPGQRLPAFEALHILYALTRGLAEIHARREYHGDIHDDNILVRRRGVFFEVKLVDFFYLGAATTGKIRDDMIQLVRVLYDIVGGRRYYARQPEPVRYICCGLRHSLITRRFPTAARLRDYLEQFEWPSK